MKTRQVYTNNVKRSMIFAGSRGFDFTNSTLHITFDASSRRSITYDMQFVEQLQTNYGHEIHYENGDDFAHFILNDNDKKGTMQLHWHSGSSAYDTIYTFYCGTITQMTGNSPMIIITEEGSPIVYVAKSVGHASIIGESIFVNDECEDSDFKNRCTYANKIEAVRQYLLQHLAIIKHELWYDYEYGLPLLDSGVSKAMMDAAVVLIIDEQPDIINLESFESKIDNHEYHLSFSVMTKYGKLDMIDTL